MKKLDDLTKEQLIDLIYDMARDGAEVQGMMEGGTFRGTPDTNGFLKTYHGVEL